MATIFAPPTAALVGNSMGAPVLPVGGPLWSAAPAQTAARVGPAATGE